MGDQMAEMGAKFAVSAAVEVFKECLKGIKGVSEWISSQAGRRDPLDRAAKNYVNHFAERYNVMRVFGMGKPIPLTDIYVRVNILERITARQWKSREDLEKALDRDRRGFGIPKESRTGIYIANEFPKFIVLGNPGSGKTTYLKYIGLQAFGGRLGAKLIPIFVSLKDFADSGQSLMDYVLRQFDICRFPKDEEFVERLLERGRCILLLDGLDEVGKDESSEVIREVRDLSDKYSDNRFILSCRIAAYNWQFEKFADTELADFTDKQIENFIDSWFGKGSKKAISCWSKLRDNPPIKELASIPLLLTLLCMTFDENMEFPKSKAELYKDAIDALLRKWDASRSIERDEIYKGLSTRCKENVFSRIAAETFSGGQFFIPHRTLEKYIADFIENLPEADQDTLEPDSEAILRAIEAQHGMFVERAKGIHSFSHLTIQEYYTAKYIVDHAAMGSLQGLVDNHLADDRWRDVFLMTTEMLPDILAGKFLLMMKKKIDAFLSEHTKLAEFLSEIYSNAVKRDSICPSHISRAVAIHYVLIRLRSRSLVPYLSIGLGTVYEPESVISGGDKRQLAIVSDRDTACLVGRELVRVLSRDLDADYDPAQVLDLNRTSERDQEFDQNFDSNLTSLVRAYLKENCLLVDCLNTDCYVSRDTRQRILDELLTMPEPLADSESS